MNILVLNTGSSSIKYRLFAMPERRVLATGLVERIGEERGKVVHKKSPGQPDERLFTEEAVFSDHKAGLGRVAELLVSAEYGSIKSHAEVAAVGHRIVHGGERYKSPTRIDADVKNAVRALIPLAPLHNPPGLVGIETAEALFADSAQIAVFDTAFHATMPPEAFLYPVPYELYEKHGVRRYGFHGSSHSYVARRAAKFLGKRPEDANLVTIHLGNGCSMAAVQHGKALDTSLGMTPLAGLMMGTRSGDVDPGLHAFLNRELGLSPAQVDDLLNKKSGLKGVCGKNDMRDVHAAAAAGDQRAELALAMFARRVTAYVGAYAALLGDLDAIVFTAGIGENDAAIRERICRGLGVIGAQLDPVRNRIPSADERAVHTDDAKVAVLVIPTNEELEIALGVMSVLQTA